MISTSDRQQAIQLIDEARTAGTKLRTCDALVVGTNTYFRRAGGDVNRPLVLPAEMGRR